MARGVSTPLRWRSAVPDLISGGECNPSAIDDYNEMFRSRKRRSESVITSVRKHLLYLGWRIDYVVDKVAIRMRYRSPEGEFSYSLRQVCANIIDSSETIGRKIENDASSGESPPSDLTVVEQVAEASSNKLSKLCSPSDEVVIEPDYCPEAVTEYYSISKQSGRFTTEQKSKVFKAKQHLSALGWSFYYHHKGGKFGRREIRYSAPSGKVFASLLSACKWCVEEGALTFSDLVGEVGSNVVRDFNEQESYIPTFVEESPGDSCFLAEVFLNLPNESFDMLMSEGYVVNEVCELTSVGSKKRRNDDELHCGKSPRLSKRGRKSKSNVNLDAGFSTPVRRSSKRVRKMNGSSCQQAPRTVLSWLVDNDVVLAGARVEYRGKNGFAMAEGRIAREGIECSCCGVIFTLSKFEVHAGSTNHRPSANIFLDDGRSLAECQLQVKQREGSNGCSRSYARKVKGRRCNNSNDDICTICHDGGELVLCDQCPSSFHTHCVGLKEVPEGDWFCPPCCCQICGTGKLDGKNGQVIDSSVLTCCQCERKYHSQCLRNEGITNPYPEGYWFCQDTCEQIFCGLHKILGKSFPVGTENLTWTLLKHVKSDSYDQDAYGDERLLENYGKLNVALSVIHECFEPVKEPTTGRDLVEDVIFSRRSELDRLNFGGFYTVVLEKNDELISAATVRIYGKRVAEVPLVATRFQYRRLGMCRILMNELEKKLVELGVERLVLPAVPSVLDTWTTSFGFSVMNESERLKFLDYTFLDFQGTVICQKVLAGNLSSVSSQSTETQAKSCDHVNISVYIKLDGNSEASEFFQGEQVEETDIVELGSTCIATVMEDENDCSAELAMVMGQSTPPNRSPFRTTIADEIQAENYCKVNALKCYTRRRVKACRL